uniref:Uncharacterized protein n=1 Tax=Rhizophora mucronata TaxID=61149 RepID=A0A2P2PBB1_RHIMU
MQATLNFRILCFSFFSFLQ